ncbi:CD209 antigen-like protein A isoform X1 [Oreochromis niloticus]|uniref:CD209 antigen-like protein A isoform X1 n=1 Tax=Oreochromis niloticus TaxID=8128 RepID=UPI0009056D38|nr:CD209 antigen-like protein A isoform X1 [Oreochromis niloticus]
MMEEIYMNAEYDKFDNAKNCTGPRKYKRSFHSGVILCLGLLSFFLLIGLITLGVYFRDSAADVSAKSSKLSSMTEERDLLKANLSTTGNKLSSMTEERDLLKENLSTTRNKLTSMTEERDLLKETLSTTRNKLTSMTEERDLLQANLAEKTNELERLQEKTCLTGWTIFSGSCYFPSVRSGIWGEARQDCRDKGADLVVIKNSEEQNFLATIINDNTWIGLTDHGTEGQWKWVDGTPLTLANWAKNEPNNGGSRHGEEDCVHIRAADQRTWNDISCTAAMKWICKKIP